MTPPVEPSTGSSTTHDDSATPKGDRLRRSMTGALFYFALPLLMGVIAWCTQQ